jgi:hypothetical protein
METRRQKPEPKVTFQVRVSPMANARAQELNSEQELVEFALDFANDEVKTTLPSSLGEPLISALALARAEQINSFRDLFKRAAFDKDKSAGWREALVGGLKTFEIRGEASCMGNSIRFSYRIVLSGAQELQRVVAILLLDPTRDFADRIHRCEIESCNRYFLAKSTKLGGRPNRKYCSYVEPDGRRHYELAHDLGAPRRVEKWRKRNPRKPK